MLSYLLKGTILTETEWDVAYVYSCTKTKNLSSDNLE